MVAHKGALMQQNGKNPLKIKKLLELLYSYIKKFTSNKYVLII
jgi:hypothetical protein